MAAAHPPANASGAGQERAQTATPRAASAVTDAHQNSLGKIVLRKRGRTGTSHAIRSAARAGLAILPAFVDDGE
jgi:hypothetical protein